MVLMLAMRIRSAVTLALLALLLVVPPIAMAMDHCAGMNHMCEAPCGASGGVVVMPVGLQAPQGVAVVKTPPPGDLPVSPVVSLDPPPKPVLLSA